MQTDPHEVKMSSEEWRQLQADAARGREAKRFTDGILKLAVFCIAAGSLWTLCTDTDYLVGAALFIGGPIAIGWLWEKCRRKH